MRVNTDPNALTAPADDGSNPPADQVTALAPKPKPVNLAPVPLGVGAATSGSAAPKVLGAVQNATGGQLPSVPPISSVPPTGAAGGSPVGPSASLPPVAPAAAPATAPLAPKPLDTLSGAWTPPTASAESAPLIASAAGGTMTPQGDAANSFRGYETSQGGGFGGYMAEKGAAAPLWSGVANGDPKSIQTALSSSDPELQRAAAESVARMLTMNDTQGGGIQMLKNLSPEQRALVQKSYVEGNPYAADQAGYDKNRANGGQSALYQQSWDRFNIDAAPAGLPVGANAGNWTAKDPAEQERLLAGQAAGTVPTGMSPVPVGGATGGQTGSPVPPTATVPTAAPVGGTATTTAPPMVNNAPGGASSGAGASSAAGAPGVSTAAATTPFTANDNFLNQIISRAPTADRFKIAQEQYDTAVKASDPQYQADLRDAMRKAAAGGALGSGMLNTSLGDISRVRQNTLDTQRTGFLDEALKGTIGDSFGDAGIAQQQQGFQAGRSDTAFNQGVTEAQLKDTLTNSSFGRALQQLVVGQGGSPADALMTLSAILSGQAGEAGQSLTDLIRGNATTTAANAGNSGSSSGGIADWLKQILASGTKPTTGTLPSNIPPTLPTGQAIGGGTGPTNPLAVGY